MYYWTKITKKVINWFHFINIMKYTTYRIENDITLLPSMLKMCSIFQIPYKYDNERDDENDVKIITTRCSNCGKQTGLSMDNMNTKYKDIVTVFGLNTLLHHVDMSRIVETHERLKYDIYKHNQYWITGGPWYNTPID